MKYSEDFYTILKDEFKAETTKDLVSVVHFTAMPNNMNTPLSIMEKVRVNTVLKCVEPTNHPKAFLESNTWWIPSDSITKMISE